MAEAARWFFKAATQGEPEAQYYLGICYSDGTGVPRDAAEAALWWRRAADNGHREALQRLVAGGHAVKDGEKHE